MKMSNRALVFSFTISFAFLIAFAIPWYYSIWVHGFPYFAVAEPVAAIWLPESVLLVFALIYVGRAIIHLSVQGASKDNKGGEMYG